MYYTPNYFLETKICFVKKIVKCLLRFMYLRSPEIGKNDSRKPFTEKLLDTILYAPSFSVHNTLSHFYDMILA